MYRLVSGWNAYDRRARRYSQGQGRRPLIASQLQGRTELGRWTCWMLLALVSVALLRVVCIRVVFKDFFESEDISWFVRRLPVSS